MTLHRSIDTNDPWLGLNFLDPASRERSRDPYPLFENLRRVDPVLRDGFVATSLAAIAEEARLTKGAVYSNFESKEDLFLALLQQADEADRWYAPSDVDPEAGRGARERAAAFARSAAEVRPSRRHVALFLEMNAFALRSEPMRKWVAEYNRRFFRERGEKLRAALDAPDADPVELGLVAQSLFAGLMMHGAYDGDVDEATFERAYELLAGAAERSGTARRR